MQHRQLKVEWRRGLFGQYVDSVMLEWGDKTLDLSCTPLTEQQARWVRRQAKKTADRRRLRTKKTPTVAAVEASQVPDQEVLLYV